jgi:hypothetical protein
MFSWVIFFYIKSNVMPFTKENNFENFKNHKLRYTMKNEFIYKFIYSFELIIQLFIF